MAFALLHHPLSGAYAQAASDEAEKILDEWQECVVGLFKHMCHIKD